MSFSLNPISAIKLIFENRRHRKTDFAEYMNTVAQQASVLASIWEKAVDAMEVSSFSIENDRKLLHELMRWSDCNWPLFYELEEFYKSFSSVSDGYISNDKKESIVNHISHLLMQRKLTKELYKQHFSKLTSTILINEDNKISDFSELRSSVRALHNEAAKLQAIAKSAKLTVS